MRAPAVVVVAPPLLSELARARAEGGDVDALVNPLAAAAGAALAAAIRGAVYSGTGEIGLPENWQQIEAVALLYEAEGHRFASQADFVRHLERRGVAISLSTFKRWLATYEKYSGRGVRPGKGGRRQNDDFAK